MVAIQKTECAPCLSVDIRHHEVESTRAILLDVVECIDVPLIDIKVGIH